MARPPKPSDGPTAVTASEDSGGDPPPVCATGAQTSRLNRESTGGGEPDSPSWARTPTSFAAYQSRTIFRFPRRSSSGYFSMECDSMPSSPLSPKPMMADKAIQTPSLSSQVLTHALQRMGEVRDEGPETNQQQGEHRQMCVFVYYDTQCRNLSVNLKKESSASPNGFQVYILGSIFIS
uniref:Uncharacterized protein n=1 Tax=Amphilophus citrinellus TaxID=61819 RepID=A0A3Q0RUR2_AMPCI